MGKFKSKMKSWMVREMVEHFPTTENKELADLFGVCPATVTNWARHLGLTKTDAYLNAHRTRARVLSRMSPHKGGPKKGCVFGNHRVPKPTLRKPVIRLDTLYVYPSATIASEEMASCKTNVARAVRKGHRVRGVRVMYYKDYLSLIERIKAKPIWERTAEDNIFLQLTTKQQ